MWRRHPRALYLLALVQMFERVAAYATLPLLVLYLQQHRGLTTDHALLLFGSLQAVSSLCGLPGGLLSDRWLGARLATLLGALLLLLGFGALALERPASLWPALAVLCAGYGLFKPGLHTLVGALYAPDDPRRESGFVLLHVVLNVGAVAGPLVAEWARAGWDWPAVFTCATLGMLASVMLFAPGALWLRRPPVRSKYGAAVSDPADITTERERMRACWLLCAVAVVFWVSGMQANTSLTLFAAQNTELHLRLVGRSVEIRPGHFLALHALLVLVLLPPLLGLLTALRRRGAEPSTPGKMVWGFVASGAAFAVMSLAGLHGGDTGRVGLGWLAGCYVLLTVGELLLWPMGLTLLTRLAPPRRSSRVLGLWFASMAVGNELTGALGLLWTRWPPHRYFGLVALLSLGAAAVLLARLERLESLLAGTREERPEESTEPAATLAALEPADLLPALSPLPDAPRRVRLLLCSLALAGPLPLMVWERLPLLVRALSAVGCGLAILLCGSFLIAQAIDWFPCRARERST